ncbi:winged helix-turn-helix domain-containing protein [Glaciecola sp. 1036]|uniref:winged helix-turn-helix domain-containing protein n=1 Tax=Alteromonadaceae TaxID=72275 RepID=UPI003D016208
METENREIQGYAFGDFYLDLKHKSLFKNGQKVNLPERNLMLLLLLAQASPNPLDKDDLHQALWPGKVVSDWSLSRLVSDTRQMLGDDGENQALIKTTRSVGFSMPDLTPVEAKFSLKPKFNRKSIVFAGVAMCFVVLAAIVGYDHYSRQNLYQTMQRIDQHQENAFTAFIAQVKRRNQLVTMMQDRLGIERERQFELFFSYYADQMNDEETFICDQMRAYTDTGIYKHNQAILEDLQNNPEIYDLIPASKQLAQHLRIWIDKYHQVFSQREDMCLVYVGVEDGVPYPSEVDKQIDAWLEANKK